MNTYRVHVIEKQWGGFEADFYTYAKGATADDAITEVESRCAAWRVDSAELFEQSPIAAVVEPLRFRAVERAAQAALEVVAQVVEQLEQHEGNRDAFAPYPRAGGDRAAYKSEKAYYDLVRRLTVATWTSKRPHDPDIGERSGLREVKYVEEARTDAEAQYTAFVEKLEEKVGPVVSAELTGCHVWGHSVLTVTKADGTVERWKTQQIINRSHLGKLFNQWPTRKIK